MRSIVCLRGRTVGNGGTDTRIAPRPYRPGQLSRKLSAPVLQNGWHADKPDLRHAIACGFPALLWVSGNPYISDSQVAASTVLAGWLGHWWDQPGRSQCDIWCTVIGRSHTPDRLLARCHVRTFLCVAGHRLPGIGAIGRMDFGWYVFDVFRRFFLPTRHFCAHLLACEFCQAWRCIVLVPVDLPRNGRLGQRGIRADLD